MWKELGWLALAGAAGTLCRYGLTVLVQRLSGADYPWGTLAVNTLGCFLFGLGWSLAEQQGFISHHLRWVVLVGFLGAFTTFSTFAFETSQLLRGSELWRAMLNLLAHNVLGVLAVFLGLWLPRST